MTQDKRDAAADKSFAEALEESGFSKCPSCGRVIDRGDVSWNNGETEAGTAYAYAQIVCSACDTEIASWSSWTEASSWEEFVENMLSDMPNGRGPLDK